MFGNWSLTYRVLLIPLLAAVAFLVIVVVAPRAATRNEALFSRIEKG